MSKDRLFKNEVTIPVSVYKVWDFLSKPANLKVITPSEMGLEFLNEHEVDRMYEGIVLKYRVRPVIGIPQNWESKIIEIKEGAYFVDEQLSGPYAKWVHKHAVEGDESKCTLIDEIQYRAPFYPFDGIIDQLIIKKKMKDMFEYRNNVLLQYF